MSDPPVVLTLIDDLSRALRGAGVRYCHWKSNEAIARSLSGDNDLDLLVDRADALRFVEVLSALGFRVATPPPRKQMPGRVSLYGVDADSGRFVQVDAHFQLLLGDDMTKNYRLPIESQFLAELDTTGPLPLPRSELEYLVLVVRMVLKHSAWDAQLSYKGRLTASERREVAWLEERVDWHEVEALRAAHLPMISTALLEQCRGTLGRQRSAVARAATARRLAKALEGYDRRSVASDTTLKIARRSSGWVLRHLPWGDARKRVATGGAVVAVVGGDGSGKSTTVDDLSRFLGRHFAVRQFHLGRPAQSAVTRVARKVLRRCPALVRPGIPPWEADRLSAFPGYPYLCSHLLTARERYRTHLAARRAAGAGAIVVCDRYPLMGLETMDRPRLQRLPGLDQRPVARWMSGWEARYYRRICSPDVVIVMRVDPAVAVARRPEQDAEFVRRRAEEIFGRGWGESSVRVVDADRPLADVLADVRSVVWAAL